MKGLNMYKSYKLPLNITKRILLFFLAIWIAFFSVFCSYKEAKAMSAVVGIVTSIGIGKLLTGLAICGTVVAGGIAIDKLSQASPQDYQNFKDGIKEGFQQFVADRETAIAKEQDQSLSDQEASNIGVANARNYVNNFFSSAIETTKNTVSGLKAKALDYWQDFGVEVNTVVDSGTLDPNQPIGPTSSVEAKAIQPSNSHLELETPKATLGSNCILFNYHYYIQSGVYKTYENGHLVDTSFSVTDDDTVLHIPYLRIGYYDFSGYISVQYNILNINKIDNSFIGTSTPNDYYRSDLEDNDTSRLAFVNAIIAGSTLPAVVDIVTANGTISNNLYDLYQQGYLSVGRSDSYVPNWKRTVKNTFDNTKCGESISSGRKALTDEGKSTQSKYLEDSYPVKKSSVRVYDVPDTDVKGYTGTLGWNIPYDNVWDSVLEGDLPFPRIYDDVGAIQWPKDRANVRDDGESIDIPEDTPVDDPAKPKDDPEEPDPTMKEWEDTNGGYFYPEAGNLTDIFPFCIPFDIIYLVEQFSGVQGEAPIITIPIIYPTAIQGAMGSDRYEVIIDFNDFVVVRNVLKVFILLLFVAGLMKLTRDLIRG